MSIELTKSEIGSVEILQESFAEQGIDCDISLPDYCPDIMRILKCSVINGVTNSKITGDRASVDANAKIRVIYVDEKNGIYSYEQDYPFSKYAELTCACDGAVLSTELKTEYVNCRAVSKKRIDIHGVISVRFRVLGIRNDTIITDASGDGVQLRKQELCVDSTVAVVSKKFQVSETEAVPESDGEVRKIISASAAPILTETKTVKGKILLKGEVAWRVTYCAEQSDGESGCVSFSLPFSEIVEVESVAEGCHVSVGFNVEQATAEPKADNDGGYKYLNLCCDICAVVTVYISKSVAAVTDAYSTCKQLEAKYCNVTFTRLLQNLNDTIVCRESLDLSSMSPQNIYAVMLGTPLSKCFFEDGKLLIKGSVPVKFILLDTEGTPVFCEREAEFEYSRSADCAGSEVSCEPQLFVSGCGCTLGSDGRAELKAEISINACLLEITQKRVLTQLKAAEGATLEKRPSALVICFCNGGEKVWDIARKYNTTVEDIMSENELSSEEISEKMMLVIPVK